MVDKYNLKSFRSAKSDEDNYKVEFRQSAVFIIINQ
jgi:hypothetical protein